MSNNNFLESPLANEIRQNKRLQWLLLIIAAILVLSVVKGFIDVNDDIESELDSKESLLIRLKSAAEQEISPEIFQSLNSREEAIRSSFPVAVSVSIAEAEALSAINAIANGLISDGRAKLIGSDTLTFGEQIFWQVRVEYQGELSQRELTALLGNLDGSKPEVRLVSFRYRIGRSNSVNLILDFLYRKDNA